MAMATTSSRSEFTVNVRIQPWPLFLLFDSLIFPPTSTCKPAIDQCDSMTACFPAAYITGTRRGKGGERQKYKHPQTRGRKQTVRGPQWRGLEDRKERWAAVLGQASRY